MKIHNLKYVYDFASLVDDLVQRETEFWNYNSEDFIERSLSFKKKTLLHLYIETSLWNEHDSVYRKYGGEFELEVEKSDEWFEEFLPDQNPFSRTDTEVGSDYLEFYADIFMEIWVSEESSFRALFKSVADSVFYIVFSNRILLLNFNITVSKTVSEINYAESRLTSRGKIKRKHIPQWVKKAVYARDKGRCVKCLKDLSGLLSTDRHQNYDHMVPLNLHGVNDPTNIQLLCRPCNLAKSGNVIETSELYSEWW